MHERNDHDVVAAMDASHGRICAEQRTLFSLIAEADRRDVWQEDGARDMAHWLWMRYGISDWKARRWIDAARALEALPLLSAAFASGALGVDKVVELTASQRPRPSRSWSPGRAGCRAGPSGARASCASSRSGTPGTRNSSGDSLVALR